MDLESVVARLAQQVERRYYGKYRGFVVDNADPEQLGRLRVTVPSLLGDRVVTGWASPCLPYGGAPDQGSLWIPEVDAGVWVEFEEGDLEFPIWVGTFWSKPGGDSQLPRPNDAQGAGQDAVQDPPTRKIFKTRAGHTLQFEDADGELRILIGDGQEENRIVLSGDGLTLVNKQNTVILNDDGITIVDANGNTIEQSGAGITVTDANNNTLAQESAGIRIEDANGNSIALDATSGGPPPMPGVAINGSRSVCLDGLLDWLLSHTHIGNMGAPCPLNPADIAQLTVVKALPDGSILSQKLKTG